jgi:hypothetical protein
LFLILFSAFLQAKSQSDTPVFDSAAEVMDEGTKEVTNTDEQYFSYKWQSEDDSFSVQQRHVPDSLAKEMQQDDDFWYAHTEIKKPDPKLIKRNYVPLGRQPWFQTLLWLIIIGGFAAAIIWYLASSNVGLFRKRNIETRGEISDEIPEDIFAINYQKEIDKAEKQGNYRFAIRLMFLRLLKDMTEKSIIQYKQDRTNFDYLLQLQPTVYYSNFFRITRNYEYSWYGHFDVNEEAYRIIRSDFDQFDRQLR